jgi:hypothetical protein
MRSSSRTSTGIAAVAALLALAACSTDPAASPDKKVASGVPADCPIGSHICRRGSSGPTDTVSAETMRQEGMTNAGGIRPGAMINHGGGS